MLIDYDILVDLKCDFELTSFKYGLYYSYVPENDRTYSPETYAEKAMPNACRTSSIR